ncbi:MAG: 50S ribosomal protein L28 [Prevotellaceae bacterium]|jgi:large subunit ribosomal protein L28|nr:50S ribosomal protein L28 [Prevotellaceae bacterium]
MSRICQITGKKEMKGNNVSHSKRRTKREFIPNLREKRFWYEEKKCFVTLKVSAAGIRTINKIGLAKALERAVENGYLENINKIYK